MIRTTIDAVGQSTLLSLKQAGRLNHWMFEEIRPYLGQQILEIGSGIGNISGCAVEQGFSLSLSDYSTEYARLLRRKFSGERLINGIYEMDLADEHFSDKYDSLTGRFDTVFALNVVEHIEDDRLALAHCHELLRPGGRVIILVPAYPSLYNSFDRGLEHFRRYTRGSLGRLLRDQGFTIEKSWYFNAAGILGWYVSGSLLKRSALPAEQLSLFNHLVPLFRIVDRLTCHQIGLSVIAVGRKVTALPV